MVATRFVCGDSVAHDYITGEVRELGPIATGPRLVIRYKPEDLPFSCLVASFGATEEAQCVRESCPQCASGEPGTGEHWETFGSGKFRPVPFSLLHRPPMELSVNIRVARVRCDLHLMRQDVRLRWINAMPCGDGLPALV